MLTVHDELVVEALDSVVPEVVECLKQMVEDILPIELPVDVETGINWYDLEKI